MNETTPQIPKGIAMNMADRGAFLLEDAEAVIKNPIVQNRKSLIASMRITLHRVRKALAEIGEEP